jgi:hypothetical protein
MMMTSEYTKPHTWEKRMLAGHPPGLGEYSVWLGPVCDHVHLDVSDV